MAGLKIDIPEIVVRFLPEGEVMFEDLSIESLIFDLRSNEIQIELVDNSGYEKRTYYGAGKTILAAAQDALK